MSSEQNEFGSKISNLKGNIYLVSGQNRSWPKWSSVKMSRWVVMVMAAVDGDGDGGGAWCTWQWVVVVVTMECWRWWW
ncbi:hypothetical protein HanPSC8_Chr08g0322881 [Helianthus annuus]|nr:hypothetical protein HanPSC8_Chr08g0322881 [Helianthus annuus]